MLYPLLRKYKEEAERIKAAQKEIKKEKAERGEEVETSPEDRPKRERKKKKFFDSEVSIFMSRVVRKLVIGVSDQAQHKLGCTTLEDW